MVCLSLFQTVGCQPPFNQRLNPWIQPLVSGQTEINSHPPWKITIAFWTQSHGDFGSDSFSRISFLLGLCLIKSYESWIFQAATPAFHAVWCVALESGDQPITRQMQFMTCNQGQPNKRIYKSLMTGEQRKKKHGMFLYVLCNISWIVLKCLWFTITFAISHADFSHGILSFTSLIVLKKERSKR